MTADNEILQRVTRIESRLCRLGDALCIDLRASDKGLKLGTQTDITVVVHTPAMDVALSQIGQFLTREGIEGKVALIYFRGALMARVYPKGEGS